MFMGLSSTPAIAFPSVMSFQHPGFPFAAGVFVPSIFVIWISNIRIHLIMVKLCAQNSIMCKRQGVDLNAGQDAEI
ncbi:hypothetical protein F0562_033362 [Nyssa sinensis]|uniref:Uncharacterized protein n=1 Tax=Nyssa sinensis TaxID=561372 RepID=A0A5J5APS6_9ASTE|nr:hypothetical protein F0562_033362 [Nyssa sinensis]